MLTAPKGETIVATIPGIVLASEELNVEDGRVAWTLNGPALNRLIHNLDYLQGLADTITVTFFAQDGEQVVAGSLVVHGSHVPLPSAPSPTPITFPTPTGITLVVASTADSGPGTLRQALLDASRYDVITFDPATFPPDAPVTISITSALPEITQGNIMIDGSNSWVIFDGSGLPRETWTAGLIIASNRNTTRGLQFVNFSGAGIVIGGNSQNNIIGGDRSIGRGPIGQGNLISGNSDGIAIWNFASNNVVTGNLVGTDTSGIQPMGKQGTGVLITENGAQNVIGPYNIIAYIGGCGIRVEGSDSLGNTFTQNGIFGNEVAGICLAGGGNVELRAPVLFDLRDGIISGTAYANCIVEIFSDSGDEGAVYEGSVVADANGAFTFTKDAPFAGPFLTATATDPDGNTSEFSPPIQVTSGIPTSSVVMHLGMFGIPLIGVWTRLKYHRKWNS